MLIKRKKLIFISFFFLIIILFLLSHLKTAYLLEINDLTNKKVYTYKLEDNTFSLGYTHSVMKTETEEFFVVDDDKMRLIKTEYRGNRFF